MSDNTQELHYELDAPIQTAEVIARTAQQAVLPRKLDDGGIYAILNGDTIELVETPGFTDARTDRRAGTPRDLARKARVRDEHSLINYLAENTEDLAEGEVAQAPRVGQGCLEVWADLDARKVTAILDGVTGWRKHSCEMTLTHSKEWDEWRRIDGKLLPQVEFAQFVEDHLSTIGAPDGAILLDICQTLQGTTSGTWGSQQILANGQRKFRFEENVEARAGQKHDLTVPSELTLVLRPFTGSAPVAVPARFRFRVSGGQLTLGVRLAEPDRAVEDAFAGIVERIAEFVPVPVLNGSPS